MRGLTMDYQLTVPAILRRAEALSGGVDIVSRLADRTVHRYRYADMIGRAKRLAVALKALGVVPGDRVATLAWNHHQHLEAYFAIPSMGAVLHTLNLRLHVDDLAYIVADAGARVVIADRSLLPLFERVRERVKVEHVIVTAGSHALPDWALDYEAVVAEAGVGAFEAPELDERDAAAMCYSSGTTGRPKGVLYSHRAIALHAMNWTAADTVGVGRRDVVLAVVPMFHINGWGLPFTAAHVGAKLVLPGPFLDANSLLELIEAERVTVSAGVPTVWLDVLHALDRQKGSRPPSGRKGDGSPSGGSPSERRSASYDVSSIRTLVIGGSAAPTALLRGYQERHGVTVVQAWGMTETTSLATVCRLPADLETAPAERQYAWRAKQGVPMPFIEIRARGDGGLVPWDGETMGELEVRGPTVVSAYYNSPDVHAGFTDDHWLRTGDIVTIDPRGCVEIHDRAKDLIKSGGEWISSVALENALMGHPAVAEAAVIAVPHAEWGERPLAVVVLKPGHEASAEHLRQHLAPSFAKWWLPDGVEFVDQIPRTATGKFLKSALRQRFGRGSPEPRTEASDPIDKP
jgi:fatty-acyl-CoA synthase